MLRRCQFIGRLTAKKMDKVDRCSRRQASLSSSRGGRSTSDEDPTDPRPRNRRLVDQRAIGSIMRANKTPTDTHIKTPRRLIKPRLHYM